MKSLCSFTSHDDEKLRDIIAAVPGVIYQFISRPEGSQGFSFLSEGVKELFGVEAEEVYRDIKAISSRVHPEDKRDYWDSIYTSSKNGCAWCSEFRIVTPEGGEKWVQGIAKPEQLSNGVTLWNGVLLDITARKALEAELNYLSTHDQLTGLYSRAFFETEIARRGTTAAGSTAIIVCDIDGLKLINDTFGHSEGDRLLTGAAGIIGNCLRSGDIAARIGGDEFAALLPDTTQQETEEISRNIRDAIVNHGLTSFKIPFSISVGFAVSGEGDESLSSVFKAADDSMYREKLHHTGSMRSKIIHALGTALEARDYITDGHASRLQGMALMLAMAAGLPEKKFGDLRLLARFHDIGKVAIPDEILFKSAPLESSEAATMRKHCEIGHRIALSLPDLAPIADWILKHHEWWNGSGYPLNLSGEQIPLECRILAIVDAYDAMINDRPYRKAMSATQAIAEILSSAGTQFDPALASSFAQLISGSDY